MSQTPQLERLYGFKKVQALQAHFGAEEEDDDGDWGGDDEDKQIWQVGFCEGVAGLRKVHFLHSQDIVGVGV